MSWTPGSPEIKSLWSLDPQVVYLNHGSFGATPRSVLAVQSELRAEMEAEPIEFLGRSWPARVAEVRERVARFVGADPRGLAFVTNATQGVAAALAAVDWCEGDEIVIGDHGYNAVKQAIRRLVIERGVRLVEARIPFPLEDRAQIVEAFARAITPSTRMLLVDHVTSPTALLCPVFELVALARARGCLVLVDGAHAPGMLPLDLEALGADFYTGNLHKWVCAAKGSAIFYASPEWRGRTHAPVTSHGYTLGFHAEFDWPGTFDATAWLSLPAALDHGDRLDWQALRANNHALVREGRERVAHALGVSLPHPDDELLYGSMAAIPFPRGTPGSGPELNARLYAEHRIEVPFTSYDGRIFVRISGQAYNAPADYSSLASVLASFG